MSKYVYNQKCPWGHILNKEVKIVDKNLLLYEMNKRNVTIKMMCEKLGISRSAFYRKCNGITEFTLGEIQTIVDYLELGSPDKGFFSSKVS
jgi:ACT domain-containing protein